MHKRRDRKGRFIASKIAENSRNPPKLQKNQETPPHTNSTNVCVGKILRGESSKVVIETTTKGPKSEAIVHIENILQQAGREALVTQSEGRAGKETEVVVEEVESPLEKHTKYWNNWISQPTQWLNHHLVGKHHQQPIMCYLEIWQMRREMQTMKQRHLDSQY
jgi:hypothetical protein